MLKDKLLMLCKTLTELLDKKFIYISNFPATALVLFAKKSSSRLYFCINYHALNQIIRKNYYLLLLINKTLERIEKTR